MLSTGYCNTITNKVILNEVAEKIVFYVDKHSDNAVALEDALVKAIYRQESKFKTYSIRIEPHLKEADWYLKTLSPEEKTNELAYCSLGVGQILFGIAKYECGFTGTPEELILMDNAIEYSVLYIKKLIRRYWNIEDVVSSYNQGTPRKNKKGSYCNQSYVTKVLKYYKEYGGKVKVN